MTTKSNRPVSTAVVCGTWAGAGTMCVAALLGTLTQAGHAGDRGVLVDLDSGALDVLGQPPYKPRRPVAAYRRPLGVDCGGS